MPVILLQWFYVSTVLLSLRMRMCMHSINASTKNSPRGKAPCNKGKVWGNMIATNTASLLLSITWMYDAYVCMCRHIWWIGQFFHHPRLQPWQQNMLYACLCLYNTSEDLPYVCTNRVPGTRSSSFLSILLSLPGVGTKSSLSKGRATCSTRYQGARYRYYRRGCTRLLSSQHVIPVGTLT